MHAHMSHAEGCCVVDSGRASNGLSPSCTSVCPHRYTVAVNSAPCHCHISTITAQHFVIRCSISPLAGFGHLLVATSSQCHIFNTASWNTPHIFDLKDAPLLLMQCERCFLLVDASTGVQIFTYDGRQICNPRFTGLRPELLSRQGMSLSSDTLALLDPADSKTVRCVACQGEWRLRA